MTLIELLIAELIGGVVVSAAIVLVIMSLRSSTRVADRVNSLSQGRALAAQIEQRLGSQVCLYAGEYQVNGATIYTGPADSIVYAGTNKIIFFADINRSGATASTASVGFVPYLRFLSFDQGITTGTKANRLGSFVDGWRPPANSASPFNFDLSPLTGNDALDRMGTSASIADQVVPTTSRKIVEGVTNDVTGVLGTPLPFYEYFDSTNTPITVASGAVPTGQLGGIGRIRVNYRILAESGNDRAPSSSTGRPLDDRTAAFNTDIYLRTTPSICG